MKTVPQTDLRPSEPPSPTPDLDTLGERIAELSAHIQAATYRLLTMIREFDQRDGWHAHGARSCAHWLNWRTGLGLAAAREKVRVARALEHLAAIGRAMRGGELSYSKVRALTRVATPENEEELLIFARSGTAAQVERLVRAWRRVDRIEAAEEAARRLEHRHLTTHTDEDGMLVVRARLTPEAGAALLKALEAAGDELYERRRAGGSADEDEPTRAQMRADAMELVAESALGGGLEKAASRSAGDRYQVVVHVDPEALAMDSSHGQAALEDGVNVSAETSRRIACDASRVLARHGPDGSTLDIGRKTRTVPPALRRALRHRDGGCRFPGCGVKVCDAHHVHHWADGGPTRLDNLVLLCRRHHTAIHQEGFRVLLRPDGGARFFTPRGRPLNDAPPLPRPPARPARALKERNQRHGLEIDSETGFPDWTGDGGSLDGRSRGCEGSGQRVERRGEARPGRSRRGRRTFQLKRRLRRRKKTTWVYRKGAVGRASRSGA